MPTQRKVTSDTYTKPPISFTPDKPIRTVKRQGVIELRASVIADTMEEWLMERWINRLE
jgi:hypothetical protein